MNSFLDRIYLDNSVRDYLWVLGVILFVLILNRLISKYLAILLCKIFKRAWKTFDQQKFVDLIIVPLGIMAAIRLIPANVLNELRTKAAERTSRPTSKAAMLVIIALWVACGALLLAACWHLITSPAAYGRP